MASNRLRTFPSAPILWSLLGLVVFSLFVYGLLWVIDFWGIEGASPLALWEAEQANQTLSGLGEVTVAVLGIALTVVAIIVELSAHRYTPRVTELFVRDPINVTALGFFVVTAVLVLWVNMSLFGPRHPTAMVYTSIGFMSLSLLALLPYFAYVFDFLSPTKVIRKIENKAAYGLEMGTWYNEGRKFDHARSEVIKGIEQLGDMILNSIEKKDKLIAIESLHALSSLAERGLRIKAKLSPEWFDTNILSEGDPDFVALHKVMVKALHHRRTWLEMKILRQYQNVFNESVKKVPDINHLCAIHTRRIGTYASATKDLQTLTMCMRFMNTYLRATINAGDVRGAYNVLNEYRLLGEALLLRGYEPLVVELAGYLKYYGQLAFAMNKAFILESAAYDLCTLLELAHKNRSACHDSVLEIFLDVDREPEGGRAQETALRGVRKAQVKLATHYLVRGAEDYARRIYEDMRNELPARLASIRQELASIEEPEYWEVVDRGINFDYLDPARRDKLADFFGWFDGDGGPGRRELVVELHVPESARAPKTVETTKAEIEAQESSGGEVETG